MMRFDRVSTRQTLREIDSLPPATNSLEQILRISIIHKVEAVACQIIICLLNMQLFGPTSEFMVTRRRLLITP